MPSALHHIQTLQTLLRGHCCIPLPHLLVHHNVHPAPSYSCDCGTVKITVTLWKYNELTSLLHLVTILVALKVPGLQPLALICCPQSYFCTWHTIASFSTIKHRNSVRPEPQSVRAEMALGLRHRHDYSGSRLLRGKATGNHKVRMPQGMDPLQKRRAGLIHWFCIGKYGGGIQGYEKSCVSYLVTRSGYSRGRQ